MMPKGNILTLAELFGRGIITAQQPRDRCYDCIKPYSTNSKG